MTPTAAPSRALPRIALALGVVAAAIIPLNGILVFVNRRSSTGVPIFIALALIQSLFGGVSGVLGLLHFSQSQKGSRGPVLALSILGVLVGLGGLLPLFLIGAIFLVAGSH